MAKVDILLIYRVLQNLIDNAIRFCREGDYINIEIISVEEGKIEIKIADSGEGINADELPFIFERYYKGKKYSESTGLGLAIVKKITLWPWMQQLLIARLFGYGPKYSGIFKKDQRNQLVGF